MIKRFLALVFIIIMLFVPLHSYTPSDIGATASFGFEVETEGLEDVGEAPITNEFNEDEGENLENLYGSVEDSAERIVTISGYVEDGMVHLTSQLTGFDDVTIVAYQWMCNVGYGYVIVAQTDVGEFSFEYDKALVGSWWKLYVLYH